MASLKELKIRIGSVKSTQKITKAMKMVAASKLKRAQERAEAGRPYAEKMARMLATLAGKVNADNAPKLLVGRESAKPNHLLIVATADRGLCGGFNGSIAKAARVQILEREKKGEAVQILLVGKKGYDLLKADFSSYVTERLVAYDGKQPSYEHAQEVADRVLAAFEGEKIDGCSIIYNKFVNALTQEVQVQSLVPLEVDADAAKDDQPQASGLDAVYEYEPGEAEILKDLLPRNVAVQIYKAMLENAASEQGARMTAMDNATRNAGEMIQKLTLQYNRSRQAAITTELTEIVAGAEAV